MKAAIFILSFLASLAFADGYNDNFDTGPLNLHWGASLQEVKKVYPGGVTWPVVNGDTRMHYSFSKDSEIYWGGMPAKDVTLSFTAENQLHQIIFQFDYVNHEEVKRRSLEIFGFAEKIEEQDGVHKFFWRSPQGVGKMLSINSTPSFEWAYFGVGKRIESDDGKKESNK